MVEKRNSWLSTPLFEPPTDFYALLERQAAKTLEGLEALKSWLDEDSDHSGQLVRDLEKEADELKLQLGRKLVESFVTPFDREDIYDLSALLDEVINAAKYVVREVEALEVSSHDSFLRPMAEVLVEGTRCLHLAFASLKEDLKEASDEAYLARKSETRFAKIYRQAIRQLFSADDIKHILKTREVYRYMLQIAEKIDVVAEKLLHIIVKIA